MRQLTKDDIKIQRAIIKHTKLNISIRKKLKAVIKQLPVPDLVERVILDFVGLKKFQY